MTVAATVILCGRARIPRARADVARELFASVAHMGPVGDELAKGTLAELDERADRGELPWFVDSGEVDGVRWFDIGPAPTAGDA